MSVTFKRILHKNPQDKKAPGKHYPQIISLGNSAMLDPPHRMTHTGPPKPGDIKSVLTHFVYALRAENYIFTIKQAMQ